MSWIERLREAAYTAPDGVTRIEFQYEDVSRSTNKKTTAFNSPDADGVFIQDRGNSGKQFPIRAFFSGPDCDLLADAYEAALLQSGRGKLEHPIYGVYDVVPFGSVQRRDDLKSAANQAIVESMFWESLPTAYTTTQDDPASDVISSVTEFNTSTASGFNDAGALDTAVDEVRFINTYTEIIEGVRFGLSAIADVQDDIRRQFNAIADSITLSIDVLVGDPITLAAQTMALVQLPARSAAAIEAKFEAYINLLDIVVSRATTNETEFAALDLFATAYVSALSISCVNTQFETKGDTLEAAEALLASMGTLTVWRDDNEPGVDVGDTYAPLLESVTKTAGFLIEISFTLKQERIIFTDRASTFVDLSAELYGSVSDDTFNTLINTNRLTGSEIIEIPKGRKIVYYV